ncbi:hypothetical protein LguiA_036681 [Lonicera macranthoides]
MQPRRIDVAELKAQLAKKIGPERSKRYFYYLNRLLSQKLGKIEFDRLSVRVLGRENLPLHNQLIRSILRNACNAKSPPPIHELGPAKSAGVVGKGSTIVGYDQEQRGSMNQHMGPSVWSNGSILPISPRKGRSNIRDRKLRDRPSPLGINGKADSAYHHSTATEDSGLKTLAENGNLSPSDYLRLVQHNQGLAERPDNERTYLKKSVNAPFTSQSKLGIGVVEDGEEVEQAKYLNVSRSPLLAPLGIPLCSASVGGARKALPVSSIGEYVNYFDNGGLFDNEMLRKRMEQIAAAQGLGEVSLECASILNSTLDVYLKQLITSCIELIRARSGPESTNYPVHEQGKFINGMWPSNRSYNGRGPPHILQEQRPCYSISLLDFKVAMELKPQQLGDDWPLLLEKICMHAFKE